jgi:lactate dehydrogenase-like 2-hydroxyacid dehydrogenase
VRKPIVVVTTHFIEGVERRIAGEYEALRSNNGAPFKPDELLAAAEGADAVLVTLADRIDAEFFKRVSASVKVIVADLAMLLLLGASRRAYEAQELVRSGAWKSSGTTMLLV